MDTTVQKTVEDAIPESQQEVQMIVEDIPDRYFAFDKEWRFRQFNKLAEEQLKLLGKDPVSIRGKILWDEFPNPPTEQLFRRVMSERTVITDEHYYAPLKEWVENRICPSSDGGVAVFQRYVTARKEADENLLEEADLLNFVHDAIIVRDVSGQILYWNSGAQAIYGWSAEEALGQMTDTLLRTVSTKAIEKVISQVLQTGRWEGELKHECKDGKVINVDSRWRLRRKEKNGEISFVELNRDITERKRIEDELRRSEFYLSEAQRLTHTGSWSWNVSTGELFWSEEQLRIFGLDPKIDPLTMQLFRNMIHPDDRRFAEETFDTAASQMTSYEIEYRIVLRDGSVKHIHSIGRPVIKKSRTLEFTGTLMDVTERRRAEEALHKAQAEVAYAARLTTMGELAASIAHELTQPLAAIITNGAAASRWLADATPNIDEARQAIERVVRDGNRARNVIARIRTLAQKSNPQKESLNLNEAVREVIVLAQGELRSHRVRLRTELAGDLPNIYADRVQFEQVVLNIFMNGIEAMSALPEEARELVIKTEKDDSDRVHLRVQDSGIGLDDATLERIFEPFYSTKPQGMGLGLWISRSIVEAYGGRLWAARRKEGPGAIFELTLPIYTPAPS